MKIEKFIELCKKRDLCAVVTKTYSVKVATRYGQEMLTLEFIYHMDKKLFDIWFSVVMRRQEPLIKGEI